jgi:hypothetical protein
VTTPTAEDLLDKGGPSAGGIDGPRPNTLGCAMNGFGNAPSGDMAASSASGATTLLIVLGALLLLGLDLIHSRLRPSGSRRPTSGREARRS